MVSISPRIGGFLMNTALVGLFAITLVAPTLMAGNGDPASWQNLA